MDILFKKSKISEKNFYMDKNTSFLFVLSRVNRVGVFPNWDIVSNEKRDILQIIVNFLAFI